MVSEVGGARRALPCLVPNPNPPAPLSPHAVSMRSRLQKSLHPATAGSHPPSSPEGTDSVEAEVGAVAAPHSAAFWAEPAVWLRLGSGL